MSEIRVLYTTTTSIYSKQYRQLKKEYRQYTFLKLIKEQNFHSDVKALLAPFDNVLFLTDDNFFVRDFRLSDAIESLRKHPDAIGFSLRLGKNTTYCYPLDKEQRLPEFQTVGQDILKYNWTNAEYDFGYPLEVSSSLYRVEEILPFIAQLPFKNPNTLESLMAERSAAFRHEIPYLLCFGQSVTFCAPVNMVQTMWTNRASNKVEYSPDNLAKLFDDGLRVDVSAYNNMMPNACHQEVELKVRELSKTDKEQQPMVSVIIPCYNQAQYLPEAVESVVDQTYQNWECIIVNDGSPDNTSEVSRDLIRKHRTKKIILLEKENGGVADARNFGLRNSKGKYILPLDADDLIDAEMLKKTVDLLEKHSEFAIAYTDVLYYGVHNAVVQAGEWDFSRLRLQNHLNYCSLYRRKVWETVGGYNRNMALGYEDWDFWVGCGEKGFSGKRIPEVLFMYRVKESSRDTKAIEHDEELRAQIILNHPGVYDDNSKERARRALLPVDRSMPKPVPKVSRVKRMKNMPMVSVIVPTYNRPNMLAETLKSILNQTCQDFEIIVVNDAGIDVEHVVKTLNQKKNITCIKHTENKGLAAARNTGIKAARGKYIAYLDDDDIFYPDHLETLIRFLETTDYKVAYTDAYRAYQGMRAGRYVTVRKEVANTSDFDYDRILVGNFIPVLCFVHEKSCIDQTGFFDESLGAHEDWDLWIRMSRKFRFGHIKKITCEFSWRTDNSTMTLRNKEIMDTTRQIVFLRGQELRRKEILQQKVTDRRSGLSMIPNTTLCCIDCYNNALSIKALRHCMKLCDFEKVIFLTDSKHDLENIEVISIPGIQDKKQYSAFIIKELDKYIDTGFVLMIQYDGFILNPDVWSDEFQKYDYIGATWFWYNDGLNVGNGGFSLRSKRLLKALGKNDVVLDSLEYGEDTFICRTYRRHLEKKYNIRFAPGNIADRFSYERSEPAVKTFGFHGLYNMWRYIKPDKLQSFINLLSPRTLNSIEAIDLGMNYQKRGYFIEAEMIYRKILEHHPENTDVQALLRTIQTLPKPS